MQLQSYFFPSRNFSDFGSVAEGYHPNSLILVPGNSDPHYKTVIISIYFFLQIFGGHFGVPIILLTLLRKKEIRRHPLLVNFLITWVLYATAFCLLLYVGKQFGPEPPRVLCLSQASLIYGAAIMSSSAGLAFVINIWFGMNALSSKQSSFSVQKWRDYLASLRFFRFQDHSFPPLIAVPYVLFVLFATAMAVVGSAYPHRVTRDNYFFYCTIDLQVVDLVPGFSGLVLVCVLVLEILIGVRLYRMHKAFASMKTNSAPPLHLIVRVVVFTIYSILSILACMGFWSNQGKAAPYIIQASLPTAAFVIFGTQSDLLHVWGISNLWSRLGWKGKSPTAQKSRPVPPASSVTSLRRGAEEL